MTLDETAKIDGRKLWRAGYSQDISRPQKKCSRCEATKNSSEFQVHTSPHRGSFLSVYCCECIRARSREHNSLNREKAKAYRADYCAKNREKVAAYGKKWRSKAGNKEASTAYLLNRLKTNEVAHFKHLTRVRIRKILNAERSGKRGRMVFLLGCTGEQALSILTNGSMEIPKDHHIDHYLPCSHFDLKEESNQRVCFNWRNLRILDKTINMEKSDKLPADHAEFEASIRLALSADSASL